MEFKRPNRDDYDELPTRQTYRLLDAIRTGTMRDNKGFAIQPLNTDFPAWCYVICDLTPKLSKALEDAGA
ncbi:MAG TPA: hypothetical protein VEH47_01930, partial [Candidatus Acidoferrales bacterium]|nr:hypothetical protein [Candidatus Acidoferrales bacterium]